MKNILFSIAFAGLIAGNSALLASASPLVVSPDHSDAESVVLGEKDALDVKVLIAQVLGDSYKKPSYRVNRAMIRSMERQLQQNDASSARFQVRHQAAAMQAKAAIAELDNRLGALAEESAALKGKAALLDAELQKSREAVLKDAVTRRGWSEERLARNVANSIYGIYVHNHVARAIRGDEVARVMVEEEVKKELVTLLNQVKKKAMTLPAPDAMSADSAALVEENFNEEVIVVENKKAAAEMRNVLAQIKQRIADVLERRFISAFVERAANNAPAARLAHVEPSRPSFSSLRHVDEADKKGLFARALERSKLLRALFGTKQ